MRNNAKDKFKCWLKTDNNEDTCFWTGCISPLSKASSLSEPEFFCKYVKKKNLSKVDNGKHLSIYWECN